MRSPKPHIENLAPVQHGGINYAELSKLGWAPEDILDFSVNTNPFGPPPGLREYLDRASIERYPDSDSTELKQALAENLGLAPDNLLIGSGATELIRLVTTAYFGTGDNVLTLQPTYGEYENACGMVNARVIKLRLIEEKGFQLGLPALEEAICEHNPAGIFLCNPNNPTGQYLDPDKIEQILDLASESLVIVDEAYISFTGESGASSKLLARPNLVIIRSLTKDYALAGLRLGYVLASSPVIAVLNRVKPPWNINSFAQVAGIFALQNKEYAAACLARIRESREYLIAGLRQLGWQPLPSQANFFLVKVGNSAGLSHQLLSRGILVRDCTSFGLPQYLRLSPRSISDCRRLIEALKEIGVDRYAS